MTEGSSDRDLIDACRAGDDDAFETLYRRRRDAVYRMALRLARDEDAALDALQEAFVYLARKIADPAFTLHTGVKLTTLLYPALRSRVVDEARARERFAGDADALLDRVAARPTPGVEADDVRRVLDALPTAQREAIELHVLDGLTLAEVAAATGVPHGTAKTRLHHGLRKLRADPATRRFFEIS